MKLRLRRFYGLGVFLLAGIIVSIKVAHHHVLASTAPAKSVTTTQPSTQLATNGGLPGVLDAGTNALTAAQIQQQNKRAANIMNEQAMKPKISSDGTKVYTLTAEPIVWNLYLKKNVKAWGYNGQISGPLMRFKVGDHVRIILKNHLQVPTSLHLQGIPISPMEGNISDITGVSQKSVAPGQSRVYQFTVTPDMVGTHAYFSGTDMDNQIDYGLHGAFIVDPSKGKEYPDANVDALFDIGAFKVDASPTENAFALNGKPYPNAPQLPVKLGQHVIIRLVNSSAESYHAMHLHGYTFKLVAEDGHHLAKPIAMNVLTLAPEETADFEFIANNPGTWMFHCHILDHTINPDDNVDPMQGLMTNFIVSKTNHLKSMPKSMSMSGSGM